MKKIALSILMITLFLALMCVNVYAGNGPMPPETLNGYNFDMAYILFYKTNEEVGKKVYAESTVKNEMDGAVYDKATNTLTITNLQTDYILETNLMGEDFKINVVGTNKLPRINIWGDGYGGTLNIVGTGTLSINEDKTYDYAINLFAEGSNSVLKIAKTVNVNLYAKKAVVNLEATEASSNGIVLENGQSVNIKKENYSYTHYKWVKGFINGLNKTSLMKITKASDPSGLYGATESTKYQNAEDIEDPNAGTKGYTVYKLTKVNDSFYCLDTSSDKFLSEAQFAEQGYSVSSNEQYENCYTYWNSYKVHQLKSKANTNEYIIDEGMYNIQGDETIAVVIEKLAGTDDIYICNPVDNVNQNDLEQLVVNEKLDDLYTYTIDETSLICKAESVQTHSHTFNAGTVTKKATFNEDGVITYTCTAKDETKTESIAKVSNVKLKKSEYTYDGKTKKPAVVVKDSNGNVLKNGTDYTVSYASGRKKVGKYKVKVTLKGIYSGKKELSFTIKPKGTTLSKVSAGKKQFKATWKLQKTETSGYEIQYSTNNKFKSQNKTSNIKNIKTTSNNINNLAGKKKYYVRIRTYKTVSGNKIYSDWSKALNVTTKK